MIRVKLEVEVETMSDVLLLCSMVQGTPGRELKSIHTKEFVVFTYGKVKDYTE